MTFCLNLWAVLLRKVLRRLMTFLRIELFGRFVSVRLTLMSDIGPSAFTVSLFMWLLFGGMIGECG